MVGLVTNLQFHTNKPKTELYLMLACVCVGMNLIHLHSFLLKFLLSKNLLNSY